MEEIAIQITYDNYNTRKNWMVTYLNLFYF